MSEESEVILEEPPMPAGESAMPPVMPEGSEDQTTQIMQPPGMPSELEDPEGIKGEPFVFPGFEGHPFRGKIPDLKKTDRAQPQVGYEGHAFVFHLSNPKHLDYYERLFHMAYNGRAQIGMDRVDFDPKTGKYTAFVRWAFIFTYMKKKTVDMGGPGG